MKIKFTYLGERIGFAEGSYAARCRNRVLLVQRGNASDELLKSLGWKIFRQAVRVIGAAEHPERVSAGLKRMDPTSNKEGSDLDTRQFFAVGVLKFNDASNQRVGDC